MGNPYRQAAEKDEAMEGQSRLSLICLFIGGLILGVLGAVVFGATQPKPPSPPAACRETIEILGRGDHARACFTGASVSYRVLTPTNIIYKCTCTRTNDHQENREETQQEKDAEEVYGDQEVPEAEQGASSS